MRILVLTIAFSFFSLASYSQTNLVPNPSFEELDKKPKETGLIELAIPWESPTNVKGDIYAKKGKNGATAPENDYGKEKAFDGDNYAGIRFYGDRGRSPRSYLQVQFKYPLEESVKYCVKFHVSLADMAKFGTNNLGVYISEDGLNADNEGVLEAKPQIMHSNNRIFEKQFYWEPICGVYEAKGDERYMTIGNFFPTEDTKTARLRRPKGFYGGQKRDSYFYIDMVSVIPLEELEEECKCEKESELDRAKRVKKSFSSDKDEKHTNKVIDGVRIDEVKKDKEEKTSEATGKKTSKKENIYFQERSFNITDNSKPNIDKMISWMKETKGSKVTVTGYMDGSEKIPPLPKKRAETVSKYMQSKGISADRITVEAASGPPKEKGSLKGKQDNMRVIISSKPSGK